MTASKVLFEALFYGLMGWRDTLDNYCAMSSLVTQNSEYRLGWIRANTDQRIIPYVPALRTMRSMTVKCSKTPFMTFRWLDYQLTIVNLGT